MGFHRQECMNNDSYFDLLKPDVSSENINGLGKSGVVWFIVEEKKEYDQSKYIHICYLSATIIQVYCFVPYSLTISSYLCSSIKKCDRWACLII